VRESEESVGFGPERTKYSISRARSGTFCPPSSFVLGIPDFGLKLYPEMLFAALRCKAPPLPLGSAVVLVGDLVPQRALVSRSNAQTHVSARAMLPLRCAAYRSLQTSRTNVRQNITKFLYPARASGRLISIRCPPLLLLS